MWTLKLTRNLSNRNSCGLCHLRPLRINGYSAGMDRDFLEHISLSMGGQEPAKVNLYAGGISRLFKLDEGWLVLVCFRLKTEDD